MSVVLALSLISIGLAPFAVFGTVYAKEKYRADKEMV